MARKYLYTDLNLDFKTHPLTHDVVKLNDVEAIKRSVRNLIMLDAYDCPFQPDKYSGIRGLLFENFTTVTGVVLERRIKDLLDRYEPRVRLEQISSIQRDDNHSLEVTVQFVIIPLEISTSISVALERVR